MFTKPGFRDRRVKGSRLISLAIPGHLIEPLGFRFPLELLENFLGRLALARR